MRRRKSVGTVRKAGGVRCLFDGRPLGLSASGLLVVGAVFGDRLTKQTGDRVWGARLQAGYGGEGGRLPAGEGRAPRQGADSVGEHQTVLQRRCARDLKSTTSCPLGRLAVCSRLRGCACATTRPMAGRGKREPSRASGGAWCEVDPDPDAAWLWGALPHATNSTATGGRLALESHFPCACAKARRRLWPPAGRACRRRCCRRRPHRPGQLEHRQRARPREGYAG
jgi:hypothetical protein